MDKKVGKIVQSTFDISKYAEPSNKREGFCNIKIRATSSKESFGYIAKVASIKLGIRKHFSKNVLKLKTCHFYSGGARNKFSYRFSYKIKLIWIVFLAFEYMSLLTDSFFVNNNM